MSGRTVGVAVVCGVALIWLSRLDGRATTALIFFFLGVIVALAVVSATGGTAASKAKENAEYAKTLGARERALLAREHNLRNEIMQRAKPMAEDMFQKWVLQHAGQQPQQQQSKFTWREEEL